MSDFAADDGDFAESAYNFNPVFMKRTKLGSDPGGGQGAGGYTWWGPPPDAGTSFGSWVDETNNIGVIAPIQSNGVTLFSPMSGEAMHFEGPANSDMRDAVLQFQGEFHLTPASRSGQCCMTSAPIYSKSVPDLFHVFTGESLSEELAAMKTAKKPQETSTAATASKVVTAEPASSFKPKTITVPKVGMKDIPYSNDGKTLKPADSSKADSAKDGLNKGTNPHGSDEPEKEKTVKQSSIKPAGKIKVPDVGMDELPHAHGAVKPVSAMSDDELVEALEAHLAKADPDGSPKLEIEFGHEEPDGDEGMMAPPPPPPASEVPMSAPPMSESPPASSDLSPKDAGAPGVLPPSPAGSPNPLPEHSVEPAMSGEACPDCGQSPCTCMAGMDSQIPVLESPQSESMMPYAHVALVKKLRATAAALRAGVKIEKADQDAMMAQAARILRANSAGAGDVAAFMSDNTKDPQTAAILQGMRALTTTVTELSRKVAAIGKPAVADKAPPFEKKEDKDEKDSKKVEEIMEDKAEGTTFEVLQSLDDLEREGITASSVVCALFGEGGVNPFWNVTVHGEPLARIYLQDQERPDEIKGFFTSAQYGEAVAKASEQVEGGLRKLLKDASARFFTLQLDNVEVAKTARNNANAEANKMVTEKLTTLSDRFLECMATAAIGMDRNFFKGGNPLKHALAENMQEHGLPIQQAVQIIEGGFSGGSADYFKALAQKANELMAMEPVAFDQLRAAIIEAGTIMPVLEETTASNQDAGRSMVQHLQETSNVIAGVQMSLMGGAEQLSEKEEMRKALGFRR